MKKAKVLKVSLRPEDVQGLLTELGGFAIVIGEVGAKILDALDAGDLETVRECAALLEEDAFPRFVRTVEAASKGPSQAKKSEIGEISSKTYH